MELIDCQIHILALKSVGALQTLETSQLSDLKQNIKSVCAIPLDIKSSEQSISSII